METETNQTTNLTIGAYMELLPGTPKESGLGADLELSPGTPKESGPGKGQKTSDETSSQPNLESDLVAPSQASTEVIPADAEISHSETLEEAISNEEQTDEVDASSKDIKEPDTGESANPALGNTTEQAPETLEEAILVEEQTDEVDASSEDIKEPDTCTGESTNPSVGNTTEQASETLEEAISDEQQTDKVDASSKDIKEPDTGESANPALGNTIEQASDLGGSTRADSSVNSNASGLADGDAQDPVTTEKKSKADAKTAEKPGNCSKTAPAPSKAVTALNSCVGMSDEEIIKAKQLIKELAVPRKNWKTYVTHGHHPCKLVSSARLGSMINEVPRNFRADFKFLVLNCGIDPDEVIKEFNGDPEIEKLRKKDEMALINEFKHIYPPHPKCEHSLGEIVKLSSQHVPHCLGIDSQRIFVYRCYVSGRPPRSENYHNYLLGTNWLGRKGVCTVTKYSNEWYSEYEFLRPAANCRYNFLEIKRMAEEIPERFRKTFFVNCYLRGKDPTAEDWTTYKKNPFYKIGKLRPHKNCKLPFADIKRLADKIPESYGLDVRLQFCRECYLEGKDPNTEDWKSRKNVKSDKGDEIKSAPLVKPPEPSGTQIVDPYAEINSKFPHAECMSSFKDIKKMAEKIPESLGPETRKRFVYHCYVDGKDPAVEDWTQYDDDPYYEFNYTRPGRGVTHTLEELKRLADKIPESFGIDVRRKFILRCWKYSKDPDKEDWTNYHKFGDKPEQIAAPKPPVHKVSKNKPKQPPNKAQVQPSKAGSSKDSSCGQSVEQLISMAEQIKSRISLISSLGSSTSGQSTEQLQSMAEQIKSRMKLISHLGRFQQLTEELNKNNARDAVESGPSAPTDNMNRSSYQYEARFSGSNAPMVAQNSSGRRHESEWNTEYGRSFPGGSSTTKHSWQNPFPYSKNPNHSSVVADNSFGKRYESEWNTEHGRSFPGGSSATKQFPYSKNPNHSSGVADTSPVSAGPGQDYKNQSTHKKNRRLRPNKALRRLNGVRTSENSSGVLSSTQPNPSGASQPFVPPRNAGLNNPPPHIAGSQQFGRSPHSHMPNSKPPPSTIGNPTHMRPPAIPPPSVSISQVPGPMMGFLSSTSGFPNDAPPAGMPFSISSSPVSALAGLFNVQSPFPPPTVNPPSWNPMPYPVAAPPHLFPGPGIPTMQPQYPCPPNFNNPSPVPNVNAHSNNTLVSSQINRPAWPEPSSSPSLKRKTTYQDPVPPKKTATVEKIGNKSVITPTPLYIVHSGHPHIRLSDEEMDAIENTILEAILEFDDDHVKPTFNESSRSNGQYGVVCNDDFTKNWLFTFLKTHQPWPNAPLRIISKEPSYVRANAVLPLCRDSDEKILKFIGKQNTGLDTSKWEVIERWDSGESKTCMNLMVDEESAKVLGKCRRVNFKLGSGEIVIATTAIVGEARKPLGQTRDEIGYSNEASKLNQISNLEQFHSSSAYRAEAARLESRSQYSETHKQPTGGTSGHVLYDSALRGPSVSGYSGEGSSQGIGSALSQNWHANSGTNASPWKHSSGSLQRASPMETSHSSSSRLSQIISDRSNFPYASTSSEPALPEFHRDPSLQDAATDRFRKLVAAGFSSEKALVFTQAYVRRQLVSPNNSRSLDQPCQQSNAPKSYTERHQSVYSEESSRNFHPKEALEMLKWFERK